MSDILLNVNGIEVIYNHVILVLKGVSMQVPEGRIVALLGGNGAGKTTTLRAVSNLLAGERGEVTKGSIELRGERIERLSTSAMVDRGVIQVMEGRHCFAHLTIEENLLTGAYTRTDRGGVAEDLERMREHFPRLAERRRQEAGTLSGGEQQMLAFARALMSRPRLICMDEPTMGLSPKLVDQVLDEIARINRELGVAVLFVEQQAELALSIASRGYVLATGAIVLEGEARDLLDDPQIQEAYLGKGRQS